MYCFFVSKYVIILNADYSAPTPQLVTDGDFKYKITFNDEAQITAFCVDYPSSKLVINKTVTGNNSVPQVSTSDVKSGDQYTACS